MSTLDPTSILAIIIAVIAATAAIASAIYSKNQVKISSESLRSQAFLGILDRARQIEFSEAMDLIRNLPKYSSFTDFESEESIENQKRVRQVVDFF